MDLPYLHGGLRSETEGADTTNTRGTAVTANVTVNTKGSYAQLVASTAFNAFGFMVFIQAATNTGDFLVDIAVGAAASEQIVVPNLLHTISKGSGDASVYFFPIPIPVGTRIAARVQSGTTITVVYVTVIVLGAPLLMSAPLGRVTAYGPNTADSGAISVDPGGSANTKGSYSQITASTTNAIKAILIVIGGANNQAMTTADWLFDFAIGAGGSEQVILANMALSTNTTNDRISPNVIGPIPVSIPAGTRLAARAQCTIIDATDRLFDIAIYGMD